MTYGGNQAWLPHRFLRKNGCGVIAAADVLRYLQKQETCLTEQEYLAFAKELWTGYLPVIPGFGMNGLTMMNGLNRYFLRKKMPYRACWKVSSKKMLNRIDEMLGQDLPVIMAIGPNFPKIWEKKTLTLYQKDENGNEFPASKTKAHFVTVTGRDERKLRISSWGKEYWIEIPEYREYVRAYSSPLVSNIMMIKRRGI